MTTLTNFEYHGKKAKTGGLVFDEKDRMRIFVCYCDNCRGKVVMERNEAECFSKQYVAEKNTLRTRLIKHLIAKLEN